MFSLVIFKPMNEYEPILRRVVFYPLFGAVIVFFVCSFFFAFKFNLYYLIVTHFEIRYFIFFLNMTTNFVQLFCVTFLQLFLESKLYKRGHMNLGTFPISFFGYFVIFALGTFDPMYNMNKYFSWIILSPAFCNYLFCKIL